MRTDDNTVGLFQQTVATLGLGQPERKRAKNGVSPPSPPRMSPEIVTGEKRTGNGNEQGRRPKFPPKTLGDLASVLRSKNSGPYELTFDILFGTEREYQAIRNTDILDKGNVARILKVEEKDIIWSGFFDQALAFKVTIPRLRKGKVQPSGGFMESDVHGSQKYLGLLHTKLPSYFVEQIEQSPR